MDNDKPAAPAPSGSRIGRFIQSYHSFLSSFVIGAAGLIATSIWQYRQSEIAGRQADSQQAIAKAQFENQWRIERAEILAKNLQVLAAHGPQTADSRYGVLLSLTRGAILDPELAVSYALELGRDNPDYMHSVLASTENKDYEQLEHGFTLTCTQQYGLARAVDACKNDVGGPRSDAIAQVMRDDVEAWALTPPAAVEDHGHGPLAPLADLERVHKDPARLTWLYTPTITWIYQKRQWGELRRIEGFSEGAHLVAALVIAHARTGEIGADADGDPVEKLHAAERTWLAAHLAGRSCDEDCRARVIDYTVTGFADAQADHAAILRALLVRPPAEAGAAIEKLHTRLARCQVESGDAAALRDAVLAPALVDALDAAKPDPAVVAAVAGLMALVPEPTEPVALAAWNAALGRFSTLAPDRYKTGYVERRAAADEQRRNPPASSRKVSFCGAAEAS
jgi:hypothetical protein